MGIEVISLAVTAAGTVASIQQGKKAERSRREGQAISSASQSAEDRAARRRAAREERRRRAIVLQGAEISGGGGSSGELGALSSLRSNTGSAIAGQRGGAIAAQGISAANSRAASAISRQKTIGAFTNLVTTGLDTFGEIRDARNERKPSGG